MSALLPCPQLITPTIAPIRQVVRVPETIDTFSLKGLAQALERVAQDCRR